MTDKSSAPQHLDDGAQETLRAVRARIEEAQNHLMDALSCRGDADAMEESLHALENVLHEAAQDEPEPPARGQVLTPDFLSEAHHAIRGVLAGAMGHLDLLRNRDLDPRHQRESVASAAEAAGTADRHVQEFFEIANALARRPAVPSRPVYVPALVEEVVGSADGHAKAHKVRLRHRIDSDARRLRVDPEAIQQILELVLAHVIESAPPRGEVLLSLDATHQGGVRIEAHHDARCAVAADHHFTPFENHRPDAPQGLAAVRELARLHGGRAEVDAKRGETVWVELPRWGAPAAPREEPEPQDEPEAEAPEEPERPRQTPRVLVVEDDKGDRRQLKKLLKAAGYEVSVATTVDEAVATVERQRFEAVTLDLLLGRSYSMRVLAALRTGINKDAAVLVLSVTRPGNVAFPYPVQGHLQKPVTKRILLRSLRWSGVPPPVAGPVLLLAKDGDAYGLEQALQKRGRQLVQVSNTDDALESLEKEAPVAVVVDPAIRVDAAFIEALEGAALLVWGDSRPKGGQLVEKAQAVLVRKEGTEPLMRELDQVYEEQERVEEMV